MHLFVAIAQLEREVGIAFQIYPWRHFHQRGDGEYFSLDLEDDVLGAERRVFRRGRFAQTVFAEGFDVHAATASRLARYRCAIRISSRACGKSASVLIQKLTQPERGKR